MKGIVLVVVLAVLVEAFIEYAKSFIKMIYDRDIKTAITQVIAIVVAVALCMAAGADLFVAGTSSVFAKDGDLRENITKFRDSIR